MKEVIAKCDICKKPQAETIVAISERQPDSSGHGYETNNKTIDLCPTCMAIELNSLVKHMELKDQKTWLNRVSKRVRI